MFITHFVSPLHCTFDVEMTAPVGAKSCSISKFEKENPREAGRVEEHLIDCHAKEAGYLLQ